MSPSTLITEIPQPVVPGLPPTVLGGPVVLEGVRWDTYEALLRDIGNSRIRLTYDRGSLEIMAPQFRHERFSETLGQLVGILAETLNLPFVRGGSTTFRRQDLLRGLEPDRCFYLQHAAEIVGQLDLDLTRDPPPDLAIEVDIWSGSINRLEIYAALGVPEVWRFDGEQFEVFCLSDQGKFEPWNQSPAFPTLPVAGVASLLQEVVLLDDLSQLRRLRAWVNQYAATPGH